MCIAFKMLLLDGNNLNHLMTGYTMTIKTGVRYPLVKLTTKGTGAALHIYS